MAMSVDPFGPRGGGGGGWNPLAGIKRNFHDVPAFDRSGFASPASIGGHSSASFASSPSTPTPYFPATPHLGSMVDSAHGPRSATGLTSPTATSEPDSRMQIHVNRPLDGKSLGLKVRENVVVQVVDQRAYQFGWMVGDRVHAVNGVPVTDLDSFSTAIAGAIHQWQSTARPITFSISRGDTKNREPRRRGGGCC